MVYYIYMKFNFEGFKKKVDKMSHLPLVTLLTLSPLQGNNIGEEVANDLSSQKIKESATESPVKSSTPAIEYPSKAEQQEIMITKTPERISLDSIENEEDRLLAQEVRDIEKDFSDLLETKNPQINKGVFALISKEELITKKYKKTRNEENNKILEITSPFDATYITMKITHKLFDINSNIKIMTNDITELGEAKKLVDEGWMNVSGKFEYKIPEYYFIVDVHEENDIVEFTVTFFDSKKSKITKTLVLNEKIPDNKDPHKFLNEKIIPALVEKIQQEIENLQ
jgi:hypothetical protein